MGQQGEVMFYVWRRSDGYVNVTGFKPSDNDFRSMTFDILLETASWAEAQRLVNKESK
jgi:hypothetical protein